MARSRPEASGAGCPSPSRVRFRITSTRDGRISKKACTTKLSKASNRPWVYPLEKPGKRMLLPPPTTAWVPRTSCKGLYDQAVAEYEQDLAIQSEVLDAEHIYLELGSAYMQMGRYDLALEKLEQGLAIAQEVMNVGAIYPTDRRRLRHDGRILSLWV